MPSLDELEHDSNEDAAKPVKGKAEAEYDPRGERLEEKKQLHGRPEDRPWLDVDNPAIWAGDVDED